MIDKLSTSFVTGGVFRKMGKVKAVQNGKIFIFADTPFFVLSVAKKMRS